MDVTAGLSVEMQSIIKFIMEGIISINIGLGIFNLIPLPPLDGSKILTHFLPYNGKQWFYDHMQTFVILFLLIWISGFARAFITPIFQVTRAGIDWVVVNMFGLFM